MTKNIVTSLLKAKKDLTSKYTSGQRYRHVADDHELLYKMLNFSKQGRWFNDKLCPACPIVLWLSTLEDRTKSRFY